MTISLKVRALGNTGLNLTELGFGGSVVGGLYGDLDEKVSVDALIKGFDLGIRYFDTAPLYGDGKGEKMLKTLLQERKDSDCILSTKVGQYWVAAPTQISNGSRNLPTTTRDYRRDSILRSVEQSLTRLGRIDIALIHDPGYPNQLDKNNPAGFQTVINEAVPTLLQLKSEGCIKAIGVGVNSSTICLAVLNEVDLDCVLLAGRFTLIDQKGLSTLLPICKRRNIGVIIGAPFNSGILVTGSQGTGTYFDKAPSSRIINKVKKLEDICESHGVSLAAAALKFPLRHASVSSVLPGIRTKEQVEHIIKLMSQPIPISFWSDLHHDGLVKLSD